MQALTSSAEPFALSDVVLSGILRGVTRQRIFDPATPMDTALAFCQRLVDWPRASLMTPTMTLNKLRRPNLLAETLAQSLR
jgi:hypothetical protein